MRPDNRLLIGASVTIALIGVLVRVYWFGGQAEIGYDEHMYRMYLDDLGRGASHADLARTYIETQPKAPKAFLPPTRVTFLTAARMWRAVSGQQSIEALRGVSMLFGVLAVPLAAAFAWRAGGLRFGCGVLALMSAAPLQIHLSHRGLIDGFFAFWALLCLWLLWEVLRQPRDWRWLTGYGAALALMVLTKENAAFVFIALLAIIAANRWLKFGEVTSALLTATVAGPAAGFLLLITLCGGGEAFFHTFLLNIQKSYVLDYAIKTGDGPLHRYLLDMFAVSPLVMLLACGGLFALTREDRWPLFLLVFVVITYAVMANLRYGMNLRYGAIWDMPLRCFAFAQLAALSLRFPERLRSWVLPTLLILVCAADLRQYFVLFVRGAIYDPIPVELLRALQMLKF